MESAESARDLNVLLARVRSRRPSWSPTVGWAFATVDLERLIAESGTADLPWLPVEDELLGARGLRLDEGDRSVVVLEPVTEGRLVRWLARNGEGVAAVYERAPDAANGAARTSTTALGTGRLVPDADPRAQLVIQLDPLPALLMDE